jgi:hypothetical protein
MSNANRDGTLNLQGVVRMPDHGNIESFERTLLLFHGKIPQVCSHALTIGEK